MSYDFYAFPRPENKVAEMHYNMHYKNRKRIFELLDAEEADAYVSGNNSWITFEREDIEEALEKAEELKDDEKIIGFLKDILKSKEECFIIQFC